MILDVPRCSLWSSATSISDGIFEGQNRSIIVFPLSMDYWLTDGRAEVFEEVLGELINPYLLSSHIRNHIKDIFSGAVLALAFASPSSALPNSRTSEL